LIEYLASSRGARYINLIEIAMESKIAPTAMILRKQPTAKWVEFDYLLLEAYKGLQNERCGQCGLPRYICHSDESHKIQFEVVEDTCEAIKAKDRHEKMKAGGKKDYEPPSGMTLTPKPVMVEGGDFVELREGYYAAEAARLGVS
jgi:ferredoxin